MVKNMSLFVALSSKISATFDNNFDFILWSLIKINNMNLDLITLNSLKVLSFAQKIVIMTKICDITKY